VVTVVGISYSVNLLSQEAIEAIHGADVVIGHEDFIQEVQELVPSHAAAFDVLDDIRDGETFLTARVRRANEESRRGLHAVVLSSGDPGLFGMGGAAVRHVATLEGVDAAARVRLIPGLSAHQFAAAALGSPLNGGFAAMALCLDSVPVEVVNKQICGIAEVGLPCVVYMLRYNAERYPELYPEIANPVAVSRDRVACLFTAFAEHRPPSTPAVLATRLRAEDECIRRFPLCEALDSFPAMTDASILILCSLDTLVFGERLVMPTW
jgi:precorrin-3B methylase